MACVSEIPGLDWRWCKFAEAVLWLRTTSQGAIVVHTCRWCPAEAFGQDSQLDTISWKSAAGPEHPH